MLRKLVKPLGGLMMGYALLSSDGAQAQTTGYVPPSALSPAPAALGSTVTLGYADVAPTSSAFASPAADCAPGVWFNIDYLLWWMKAAPAPGPLVTTGSLLDPIPGALGQPNTRVVFGDQTISNNAFSGIRLQAGTWIDEARSIGFEASVFALEHRDNFQGVSSDANGAPYLARPIFNLQSNQEEVVFLAAPGFQAGGMTAISSTKFSGWDFNVAFNGSDTGNFRADALLGFRTLYLTEHLTISDSVTALIDQGVNDSALRQGERMNTQDRFATSSNFYGGQLGGRMTWVSDRWITTSVVKLGLGVTDESASLEGLATTRGNGGGLIGSGILIYPGNAGNYFTNNFTVVPEFNLNLGYRVSKHTTLRAGYTFIYWSDVVRPSDAVSRAVNPGLNPNLQGFGTGPFNAPRATINSSEFWSQGLNLGLEFRF